MDIIGEKAVLLCLLFGVGLCSGFAPYLLQNRCFSTGDLRNKVISILNCMSAGVFFSSFFMHMLPEAQEIMEGAFGLDLEYPYSELVISLGFFFVMFVEQAVFACCGTKQPSPSEKPPENSEVKNEHAEEEEPLEPEGFRLQDMNYNTLRFDDKRFEGNTTASPAERNEEGYADTEISTDTKIVEIVDMEVTSSTSGAVHSRVREVDHTTHNHHHIDHGSPFSVRAYVLLLALSTHALFEGLAIGLQESSSGLRTLVIAVLIHKMTLSFSYGMSLISAKPGFKNFLISLVIFSAMAPIGIVAGSLLTSMNNSDFELEKVIAVTQAFASGTFVYIIFIEILPHELDNTESGKNSIKVLGLFAGFALMAAFQALPQEEE